MGALLSEVEEQESDAMDHESNLEDMIMDDAYDAEGANKAMSMMDEAFEAIEDHAFDEPTVCLLYTSPSPRDVEESRMPSSA